MVDDLFTRANAETEFALMLVITTILTSAVGSAQSTTSSLTGTVTDTSGAVVVAAAVTIANTATGVEYKATTSDQGVYRVTQLLPVAIRCSRKSWIRYAEIQAFTLLVDQQAGRTLNWDWRRILSRSPSWSAQLLDNCKFQPGSGYRE